MAGRSPIRAYLITGVQVRIREVDGMQQCHQFVVVTHATGPRMDQAGLAIAYRELVHLPHDWTRDETHLTCIMCFEIADDTYHDIATTLLAATVNATPRSVPCPVYTVYNKPPAADS